MWEVHHLHDTPQQPVKGRDQCVHPFHPPTNHHPLHVPLFSTPWSLCPQWKRVPLDTLPRSHTKQDSSFPSLCTNNIHFLCRLPGFKCMPQNTAYVYILCMLVCTRGTAYLWRDELWKAQHWNFSFNSQRWRVHYNLLQFYYHIFKLLKMITESDDESFSYNCYIS